MSTSFQLFEQIEGLEHVDIEKFVEFEQEITEVIPQIIKDVKKRQILAAESRQRIL